VVYSQPPWGGAGQVLEYLSRYTHRIAISNHRLRKLEEGQVTFDYRDRRDGNRVKPLTITAAEFIRRFLLHVLPPGFCRMRHYGFLGNRVKEEQLPRCRALLGPSTPVVAESSAQPPLLLGPPTNVDPTICPCCGLGRMVVVQRLPAQSDMPEGKPPSPALANSS
jgi:Putative transposase